MNTLAPTARIPGRLTWLVLALVLCVAAPGARADESLLETSFTKATKSSLKSFAKEVNRALKELRAGLADIEARLAAGLISPGQAFIEGFGLHGAYIAQLNQLLLFGESGDAFLLGACLDEIDEVPSGVQPGGCGIRDAAATKQARTLLKARDRAAKEVKKFAGKVGKQGGVIRFQLCPIPQPPQAAADLDAGVTGGLVKPTALLFVGAVAVDDAAVGSGPQSVVAALGLADPANGATATMRLLDATGALIAEQTDLPIDPECLVRATFEDVARGAYVVELVQGGTRLSRAVVVG